MSRPFQPSGKGGIGSSTAFPATVLHATDAGRPVYERMGYVSIPTHTLLMEKRFLEEH